jgi:hypothetical protein
MPDHHFDDALEEVFDVLTSGKQRRKRTNITKQIEMMMVFFIHNDSNFRFAYHEDTAINVPN